jgi:glycosyltransferase involved in cell wall biosynthesis
MKVLLIHQAFVSPQDAGGTRHFELARHAREEGHAMTIVASDLSYLTGKHVAGCRGLVTPQSVDGLQVLRAYTYPSLHRSFSWRLASFFSFMLTSVWAGLRAGPVDLVMGTSPPIFQAVSAWLLARLRRRPFLLEIRDLWPDFAVDMGVLRNPAAIRLSRWLELLLYRQAAHIVVNSPAYRQNIVGKGVAPEKVSVIPNGVDPGMFDPDGRGEGVRREWQLEGRFVALYAGALGLANDIPTILRAAAQLRSDDRIRIVLTGDGKERPRLQEEARSKGLTNVVFTGARPKSEMKEFLAAADVCLATLKNIPMFSTTYPNKVFDYMAAGRPTVLGIDGVIREVVEAAGCGCFVTPGDAEALAGAIRQFAGDPERCVRMGRAGRAYVVRHFNRREQAGQFVRLIESLDRRGSRVPGRPVVLPGRTE